MSDNTGGFCVGSISDELYKLPNRDLRSLMLMGYTGENGPISLASAAKIACNAERNGARVAHNTEHAVMVIDCPIWTTENASLLSYLVPDAEVEIMRSSDSLSGFVIRITRARRGVPWPLSRLAAAASACFVACLLLLSTTRRDII